MPRTKARNPSDCASDCRDVRRRVVNACQRCRLRKCKVGISTLFSTKKLLVTPLQCDGTTPCTRCKSDDTICAYGKHKKTEKLVYRKGSATSLV